MKFKKYTKIKQFRSVVTEVNHSARFTGKLNEEGKPIYDATRKPVLKFTGTVKIHGTNASVAYNKATRDVIAGKRNGFAHRDGHFGFPKFVHDNKKKFVALMDTLYTLYANDGDDIFLFGEWAGPGVQKGVGVSQLPDKCFFVFDLYVKNRKTEEGHYVSLESDWFSTLEPNLIPDKVYHVQEFGLYTVDIDFENPSASIKTMEEQVSKVENECPVAKRFGISGVGEGIVYKSEYKGQRLIFKVKGEKHSATKSKFKISVDPEVQKSINDFVDYAATENRIRQGMQEVGMSETRQMGDLMRWVAKDIISEETDTLEKSNLNWKQVAKFVSDRVRMTAVELLNKEL